MQGRAASRARKAAWRPAASPSAAPPPGPTAPQPQGVGDPARPPRARPPRQRAALEPACTGYSNLAQAAIALLLHQPDIARLADPTPLAELQGDDIALLRELLALLSRRPESSTAMLLGHWYDTPEGDLLNRLAGQERLVPREGIERQFVDTMQALARLPQRSKLAAQVDKLKLTNYAEISDVEKQRLRELLREKLQRDAERSDRHKR